MFAELKTNPRLRAGVAVSVALLSISILLDAQAGLRDRRAALGRKQAALDEISRQAQHEIWLERAQAARAERVRLDAIVPVARDAGGAEADFVDWMNQQLKKAEVGQANVLSAVPAGVRSAVPPTPDGTVFLRLNVSFEFRPGIIERVIEQLHAGGRFVVVEAVSLRRQPTQRTEMIVASVARLGNASVAKGK